MKLSQSLEGRPLLEPLLLREEIVPPGGAARASRLLETSRGQRQFALRRRPPRGGSPFRSAFSPRERRVAPSSPRRGFPFSHPDLGLDTPSLNPGRNVSLSVRKDSPSSWASPRRQRAVLASAPTAHVVFSSPQARGLFLVWSSWWRPGPSMPSVSAPLPGPPRSLSASTRRELTSSLFRLAKRHAERGALSSLQLYRTSAHRQGRRITLTRTLLTIFILGLVVPSPRDDAEFSLGLHFMRVSFLPSSSSFLTWTLVVLSLVRPQLVNVSGRL